MLTAQTVRGVLSRDNQVEILGTNQYTLGSQHYFYNCFYSLSKCSKV